MIAAGLVVAGCTAGDSTDGGDSATATTQAGPTATGPAPGVTDDAVDIGVTYVDAAALEAVGLTYDLGDYEAVYQALFDDINAEGGIHGRELRPVLAPVDPATQQSVDEACVQLTEDADVFLVIGFFLTDAVLCPVATHETAVLGGEMTTERVDQAQAPWLTWTPDGDQPEAVLRALDEAGELDGRVAVYANARDEAQVDDLVVPTLEELGVDVVEVGIETGDDIPAQEAANQIISERFQAAGADTLVLVGQSGQDWPSFRETDTVLPAPAPLPRRPWPSTPSPATRAAPTCRSWTARWPVVGTARTRPATTKRRCRRASASSPTPASTCPPPRTSPPTRPTSPTRPRSRPAPTWPSSGPGSRPRART